MNAWKESAKLYRDFYKLSLEQAREWQGKCFAAEARIAKLDAAITAVLVSWNMENNSDYFLDALNKLQALME